MWENILNILIAAINACFGWFDRLMQSIPGAWDTIFTLITIIVISRFLLAPLVGWTFTVGSDKVGNSLADELRGKKGSDKSNKKGK